MIDRYDFDVVHDEGKREVKIKVTPVPRIHVKAVLTRKGATFEEVIDEMNAKEAANNHDKLQTPSEFFVISVLSHNVSLEDEEVFNVIERETSFNVDFYGIKCAIDALLQRGILVRGSETGLLLISSSHRKKFRV